LLLLNDYHPMLDNLDLANVLFLDVETASAQADYGDLSEEFQALWKHKARYLDRSGDELPDDERAADLYRDKAGIFAEFGRVVCISVGILHRDKNDGRLHARLTSFADEDEATLLKRFSELLAKHYSDLNKHFICGHNIKEFDIPYLSRRMVVQQLPLPEALDLAGKKPWETKHLLDTLELWKFGDRKNFTSLRLLAALLGFPSPKDDMDGSEVGRVFWEERDLERIAHYCEKDVLASIQLLLRYMNMPLLSEEQAQHISP